MKEFKEAERALTFEGKIPLPPAIYGKAEKIEYSEELAKSLFELHLDKIRISDGIFVIDVDERIGESTKKEIEFAEKNSKLIRYYSKEIKRIKESLDTLNSSFK